VQLRWLTERAESNVLFARLIEQHPVPVSGRGLGSATLWRPCAPVGKRAGPTAQPPLRSAPAACGRRPPLAVDGHEPETFGAMSAFPGPARSLLSRLAPSTNVSDAGRRRAKTPGFRCQYERNIPSPARARKNLRADRVRFAVLAAPSNGRRTVAYGSCRACRGVHRTRVRQASRRLASRRRALLRREPHPGAGS